MNAKPFCLGWALFSCATSSLLASEQPILLLHGPVASSGTLHRFGSSVAGTQKYSIIGNPEDDDLADAGGAVHVFDSKTGKRLRSLRPEDPEDGANFGAAVAISGNFAVIGAPMDDAGMGSAYVFDVSNGRQLMKIPSNAAETLSMFGATVALEGSIAAIGASSDDSPNGTAEPDAGAVSFFQLDTTAKTFALIFRGAGSDTDTNDSFGKSVALSGGIALIGAPGQASQRGAAYLFNAETGDELDKWQAGDGASGDRFGWSVAISGDRAAIGAPTDTVATIDGGSVYEFDVPSRNQWDKYVWTDRSSQDRFGEAVAIYNRTILIGAPGVNGNGADTGDVFVVQNGRFVGEFFSPEYRAGDAVGSALAFAGNHLLIGAPNALESPGYAAGKVYLRPAAALQLSNVVFATYAQTKDSTPGVPEATFRSFTKFGVSPSRDSYLLAGLTGRGAPAGKNVGLFAQRNELWELRLRTGDTIGSLQITGIYNPVGTYSDHLVAQVKGKGVGINSSNDYAIIRDDGSTVDILLREGDTMTGGGFTGQKVGAMGPVVGSNENSDVAIYSTLKSGTVSVSSVSDSCAMKIDLESGLITGSIIEGTASPIPGLSFGQVGSRVTNNFFSAIATTSLVGSGVTSANRSALWTKS
ncbi:MAG: FG-GAP repeat protein, partial [Verrucomicrobiales bacterium]|nr:FG-GAP repeat protein [Verrucomicrobiales bacterium]